MEISRCKIWESVSFKSMDRTGFYGEGWFEPTKALLRDSTPALSIYKLGSFIHFKHNFALILFPKVSLHCKALEHNPLILTGSG